MSTWFDTELHSADEVSLEEYIKRGRRGFIHWTVWSPYKYHLDNELIRSPYAFYRLQELYTSIKDKTHLRTLVTLNKNQPIIYPEIRVYTLLPYLLWKMRDMSDADDPFLAPRLKIHATLACLSDEPLRAATVWLYEELITAPVEMQMKAQLDLRQVMQKLTHYDA